MLLCRQRPFAPLPLPRNAANRVRSVHLTSVLHTARLRPTQIFRQGCSGLLLHHARTSILTPTAPCAGYEGTAVLTGLPFSDDRQPPPSTTKLPPSLR